MNKINKKELLYNVLAIILVIALATGTFMFWGQHKIMWFCDEIYSYFTANSQYGIGGRIQYGTWYDAQFVKDDMSADITAGRFNRTIDNVKGDDHPPIYFLTMRLMSILMKGSISKWVGLSINYLCIMGIAVIVYLLVYIMTRKKLLSVLVATALCTLPSMMTNAMLIRMYCMLTAWAVLYVFLSCSVEKLNQSLWRLPVYIVLSVTTACGFLTQYYFAVFAAGFTLIFLIRCLIDKRYRQIIEYIISMLLAAWIATKAWGHWTSQIFDQYAGEEVLSQAADFSGIFKEILFGLTVIPKLTFYRLYIPGIILIIAGIVVLFKKKDELRYVVITLIGAGLFYSLVVAHVTPTYYLDYRYFYMPVAIAYIGIVIMLVRCAGYLPLKKYKNIAGYAMLGVLIIFNIVTSLVDDMSMGYVDLTGQYEEKREILKENASLPWVYYGYENWTMMENYYDFALGSRFIAYNQTNEFDDTKCLGEGEDFLLIVYPDTCKDVDALLKRIENAEGCEHEVTFMFRKCADFYKVTHKK